MPKANSRMGVYVLRRLLLMIPTLLGILLINFAIIQSAPGGPVEQMIFQLEGHEGGGALSRIAGSGGEVSSMQGQDYRGTQGFPETVM